MQKISMISFIHYWKISVKTSVRILLLCDKFDALIVIPKKTKKESNLWYKCQLRLIRKIDKKYVKSSKKPKMILLII